MLAVTTTGSHADSQALAEVYHHLDDTVLVAAALLRWSAGQLTTTRLRL